jgi:hypothetical protein
VRIQSKIVSKENGRKSSMAAGAARGAPKWAGGEPFLLLFYREPKNLAGLSEVYLKSNGTDRHETYSDFTMERRQLPRGKGMSLQQNKSAQHRSESSPIS